MAHAKVVEMLAPPKSYPPRGMARCKTANIPRILHGLIFQLGFVPFGFHFFLGGIVETQRGSRILEGPWTGSVSASCAPLQRWPRNCRGAGGAGALTTLMTRRQQHGVYGIEMAELANRRR